MPGVELSQSNYHPNRSGLQRSPPPIVVQFKKRESNRMDRIDRIKKEKALLLHLFILFILSILLISSSHSN
jgi:hypothetical protein